MKEEKRCTKCGEIKVVSEFYRNERMRDGFTSWCKVCTCQHKRDRYAADPSGFVKASMKYHRANRFKVSLRMLRNTARRKGWQPCTATEEELRASYTGKCEICHVPELELTRNLHVDHCHETGEFRGWLCNNCNMAIGFMRDSREIALNAVLYIQRHETKISIVKE